MALGRAVGDACSRCARTTGSATTDPFSPDAGARSVGTDAAGVRADAGTPVPERDAVHASRPQRSSCRIRRPRSPAPRYARDFNEVKLVGQDTSPARTADQTHLAHFWAEPSPSGWSRVGNLVSARYGYDLHRTARLQALLNMAMADGFIVGWYQKRHFAFWRPVTAIRKADTDGNPQDPARPTWLSLRPTPALPDYPSTHSLLGGAAAEILRRFTGTDAFPFCMVSTTSDTRRHPAVLALLHAGRARERRVAGAGGFHFRFAIETGVKVGRKVGHYAMRNELPPLRLPRDRRTQ